MANMLDYLRWRGDLSLASAPLNDIDALVLAELSYVSFGECLREDETRAVAEAARDLLTLDPEGKRIHQTGYLWEGNSALLRLLPDCPRFAQLPLTRYMSVIREDAQKQFGAMTFLLPDGDALIAFRGTDDSLVGWKEDLNLSFESPVPSQTQAAEYLAEAAAQTTGELTVCGHSKGGNLAVYAAACQDEAAQSRIRRVLSFDGPGQDERVVQSDGYARIRGRMHLYIPHFSVVGMLLEQEKRYTVVESDEKGLMQHSAFSWQIERDRFVEKPALSEQSLEINRILREWLKGLGPEDRRIFSDAVYEVLGAAEKKTLTDMGESLTKSAQAVLKALRDLSTEKREMFQKALGDLFSIAVSGIRLPWAKEKKDERAQ